jgi:hypothetical protein
MQYIGPATLIAGQTNQVEIEASGVDAGIFTLILNGDPAPDGSASIIASSFFGVLGNHAPDATQQRIVNGRNILQVTLNDALIPPPFGAQLRISIAETDGHSFESGDRVDQRVTISASSQPQPPQPGTTLAPQYDPLWSLAGDLVNYGKANNVPQDVEIGTRIQDLIRWRKQEISDPWA